MIKLSDIRVGNWIQNNSVLCIGEREFEVYPMFICQLAHCHNQEATNAEGISLTEEWLIKFGFDKESTYLYRRVTNDFAFAFSVSRISVDSWACPAFAIRHPIKYVHQLQNLYFALTQEELTLK